jgi:hypothetical protein
MKYFTPELHIRGNSPDESVVHGVEEAWEHAIRRYRRRMKKIHDLLPEGARRFRENHVCLHDAEVLTMGRQGDTFVMVLRKERPSYDLVLLQFTLEGEPIINPSAIPGERADFDVLWMYEEFDVDRQKHCWFSVLFTNGWEVRLPFRELQYLVAQPVLPVPKGGELPKSNEPVPRSA